MIKINFTADAHYQDIIYAFSSMIRPMSRLYISRLFYTAHYHLPQFQAWRQISIPAADILCQQSNSSRRRISFILRFDMTLETRCYRHDFRRSIFLLDTSEYGVASSLRHFTSQAYSWNSMAGQIYELLPFIAAPCSEMDDGFDRCHYDGIIDWRWLGMRLGISASRWLMINLYDILPL